MTEQELQQQRHERWRVNDPERGIRTIEDARGFLNSVGFCLAYPVRPAVLAPTFLGAYAGTHERLPERKKAFADPRAQQAAELMGRLLREKSAFETSFGEADTSLLVSAAEFPYFYALMGDRNPKSAPSAGERGERRLATDTFTEIQEHGPIAEGDLMERVGRSVSLVALARTLMDLWSELRIVRTDGRGEQDQPMWDVLYKWAPDQISQAMQISRAEALSALTSKYLEQVVAAEQGEIEAFFGHLASRSKVADVVRAMLAAREFDFAAVEGKTLLRISSRGKEELVPAEERKQRAPKKVVVAATTPKHFSERALFKKKGEAPEAPQEEPASSAEAERPRKSFADRKPFAGRTGAGDRTPRRSVGERKSFGERPAAGDRPRKSFGERKSFGDKSPRKSLGERKPFGDRAAAGDRPRKSFGERKPFGDRTAAGDRPRKSFGERKQFGDRPPRKVFGERKPFGDRAAAGDRPRKSFGERKQFGDRPPRKDFGERKSFGDKSPRKSFGERKSFGDGAAAGDRPRKSFGERKPFGDRPPRKDFGERKSFGDKSPRKSFSDRPRKSFADRPASEERPRKPMSERSAGERESKPSGERKPFTGARPGGRPGVKGRSSFGGARPGGKPGGKPGGRFGKPGGRPGGFGSRPGGKPSGRPGRKPE